MERTLTDWYTGATRQDRIQDAIARHGLDALLAITPENAGYLAGQSNFIATHWRIPGIHSTVIGPTGQKAVVSGDFGADPASTPSFTFIPYRSWTESVDIRSASGLTLAERVVASRPGGPIARPAQFDLDAVFDAVASVVRAVAPTPKRIGVDCSRSMPPRSSASRTACRAWN